MISRANAIASSFFQAYIHEAHEDDLMKALKKNTKHFTSLLEEMPRQKINFAYAPGKWTIKQMLQHIIDAERVFSYRALRFSRNDATPLPSFDENIWAQNAPVDDKKWKDLVKEFHHVREASILLFGSMSEEQLLRKGIASNNEVNVVALGFITAGHVAHHIKLIKERYL